MPALMTFCECGRRYRLHPSRRGRQFYCDDCGEIFLAEPATASRRRGARSRQPTNPNANLWQVPVIIMAALGLFAAMGLGAYWLSISRAGRASDIGSASAVPSRQGISDQHSGTAAPSSNIRYAPTRPGVVIQQPQVEQSVAVVLERSPKAAKDFKQIICSPDGRFVVGIGTSTPVYVWDREGASEWRQFNGHEHTNSICEVGQDGLVISGDTRKTLLWSVSTLEVVKQFDVGFVQAAGRYAGGSRMYVESGTKGLQVWDCETGTLVKKIPRVYGVVGVAATDQDALIVGTRKNFTLFDLHTDERREWVPPMSSSRSASSTISATAIAPANGTAVSVNYGQMLVTRPLTGAVLFEKAGSWKESLAISSDGKTLALTQPDGVDLFNLMNESEPRWIHVPRDKRRYNAPLLAVNADGSLGFATIDRDNVTVWDLRKMWRMEETGTAGAK